MPPVPRNRPQKGAACPTWTAQIALAERNGLGAWAALLKAKMEEGPDDPQAPQDAGDERSAGAVPRRLLDVAPEPIEWLWVDRIAIGKLTLLVGDPGLGKSLLTVDLAARVTTGRAWPDGAPWAAPASVIVLNAEDDAADTVRPRLDAAGGDPGKYYIIDAVRERKESGRLVSRGFSLDRDLVALESAIRKVGDCRLVVIDPISAYLGDGDSHVNADVRALLMPLCVLAAKCGVAVLAVTHLDKGTGSAIYRGTGSIAFVAASRAVWAVARDAADETGARRHFLPVKNNLAAGTAGLAYTIAGAEVPTVTWGEAVTVDVTEALSPCPEDRRQGGDARAFLREYLADGPRPMTEIRSAAKANGIAERTVRRAKDALGICAQKVGFETGWEWFLPAKVATEAEGVHSQEMATFGGDGHLREAEDVERVAI